MMHKHGSLLLRPLLLLQSVLKGFWDHQEMAVPDAVVWNASWLADAAAQNGPLAPLTLAATALLF